VSPQYTLRALVVDDDRALRAMLVECLDGAGFECKSACDGVEALEILAAESFDIGVFDIKMPQMNGTTLAERTKELHPDMRLVAVSAVTCTVELVDSGFDAIFKKPFDVDKFIQTCMGICGKPARG
jgi:DNA-binding response OmpR family regulator